MKLLRIIEGAFLASLLLFTFFLMGEIETAHQEIERNLNDTVAQIQEFGKTAQALRVAVNDVDTSLKAVHSELMSTIREQNRNLNKVSQDADYAINDAAAATRQLSTQAGAVLTDVHGITSQAADAAPLFFDCDHNPDCIFNRYEGIAHDSERMIHSWENVTPTISQNAASISTDTAKITHRIASPWYMVKKAAIKIATSVIHLF